jgi:hypothetical protein
MWRLCAAQAPPALSFVPYGNGSEPNSTATMFFISNIKISQNVWNFISNLNDIPLNFMAKVSTIL